MSRRTNSGASTKRYESAARHPHALYIDDLPMVHKDPFDRMLIAQALVEDMTIVSRDAHLSDYGVKLRW